MKQTAQIFKALSDETRLRILALLANGELCVCDLMAALDLPQSTVSRHLAYLRNVGLVEDARHGVWMFYRLVAETSPLGQDLTRLLTHRLNAEPQAITDRATLESLGDRRSRRCE